MSSIAIALPDELAEFVSQSVNSGEYAGPSELVVTALFALRDQTELNRIKLARLREDIAVGLGELERGECAEWNVDEFLEEMKTARA